MLNDAIRLLFKYVEERFKEIGEEERITRQKFRYANYILGESTQQLDAANIEYGDLTKEIKTLERESEKRKGSFCT